MKSILYVQYTNPAGYPPLEHSSRILAEAGWQVQFLGTGAHGADELRFPTHPRIAVSLLRSHPPGWRQKLHYFAFVFWCVAWCLFRRPTVVYCSDQMSAVIGLATRYLLRIPVIYHEHDSPGPPRSLIDRGGRICRSKLASIALACVLPNQRRLELFVCATKRSGPSFLVWNCPRREEVLAPDNDRPHPLRVFYVGVVGPTMLPEAVVSALTSAPQVQLLIAGYTVRGAEHYPSQLQQRAEELGVSERVEILGPLSRSEFYRLAMSCHVGIVTLPLESQNINIAHLLGASNKAFDYLACGLALLVSNRPDWAGFITSLGIGRTCQPDDPLDLGSQFRWFADHPAETRSMGEAGRRRVLAEWNYETQFEPVKRFLERL